MDPATRADIIVILNQTIDIVLQRVREKAALFFNSEIASSGNGTASPFSKILLPQIKLASLIERSYSASMGTAFNYIGRALTRSAYGNGDVEHVTEGRLPVVVASEIEEIVNRYRGEAHTSPDTSAELAMLHGMLDEPAGDLTVPRRIKSDLRFHGPEGIEYYIEIKTPMPNYDTCRAVKIRILTLQALRYPNPTRAVVAFPFNPNGIRGEYAWPPARYFLDPSQDWAAGGNSMMGGGLWNFLGGSESTFEDLLGCCEDVFRQRNPDVLGVLDAVTFGEESV